MVLCGGVWYGMAVCDGVLMEGGGEGWCSVEGGGV